jgi:hypothetical protein
MSTFVAPPVPVIGPVISCFFVVLYRRSYQSCVKKWDPDKSKIQNNKKGIGKLGPANVHDWKISLNQGGVTLFNALSL